MSSKSTNPLVDRKILDSYRLYADSQNLIEQMLKYYESLTPQRIEKCIEATLKSDIPSLERDLHALKNSFLNVGALQVAEECQSLEDRAAATSRDELLAELEAFKKKFEAVKSEVYCILGEEK